MTSKSAVAIGPLPSAGSLFMSFKPNDTKDASSDAIALATINDSAVKFILDYSCMTSDTLSVRRHRYTRGHNRADSLGFVIPAFIIQAAEL